METSIPDFTAASFPAEPGHECDVVMKGGITSGVVYPLAVCELARTYRLRSVGGASAGAIAAAASAAAEVGRQSGATAPSSGFLGLASFPDQLTRPQGDGRSLLFHLFRPQPGAERLFALLTGALDAASAARDRSTAVSGLVPGLLLRAVRAYPLRSALGAASGALAPTALVGGMAAAAGIVAGVLSGVVGDVARLPGLGFGLSSGQGRHEDDLALTPWLHGQLQLLAGRTTSDPALTFGDLESTGVDLRVMTTNLSRSQPTSMPWANASFHFREEEFRSLFPAAVVDQMISSPPALPPEGSAAKRRDAEVRRAHALEAGYRPFPPPDRLPILVATRMSLSFPFLITAVPLYAIDHSSPVNRTYSDAVRRWRREHEDASLAEHVAGVGERPRFDRNWFSDGGLAANLPVNFFDSPIPTRPTFAIDLAPFSRDHPQVADELDNSYLPRVNQGGLHRRTADWSDKEGLGLLAAFAGALFSTARTWVDEAQLAMPGYRDRVVTVYQSPSEGGLNLSMDQPSIDRLSLRGRLAAGKLVRWFTEPTGPVGSPTGWDNHRWIRFRTATSGLSDWVAGFEKGFEASETTLQAMLASTAAQPSYKIKDDEGRRDAADDRVAALRRLVHAWSEDPADAFTEGRPTPAPGLRLVPLDPTPDDPS